MNDELIIALYFERNEKAIAETAQKYGPLCHRIAMNILLLHEDAEECVNDTYHKAWNSMPPERPCSLKAFLGRITRNLSISRYRANHAKKRYSSMEQLLSELNDCIPSPVTVEQEIESRRISEIISSWLDTLPVDDCALFVRRYWFGDALRTLAEECGRTPSQMSQHMLKLRRMLRAVLEKEGVTL